MHTTNAVPTRYSTEEENILARFAARILRAPRRGVQPFDYRRFQVFAVL